MSRKITVVNLRRSAVAVGQNGLLLPPGVPTEVEDDKRVRVQIFRGTIAEAGTPHADRAVKRAGGTIAEPPKPADDVKSVDAEPAQEPQPVIEEAAEVANDVADTDVIATESDEVAPEEEPAPAAPTRKSKSKEG